MSSLSDKIRLKRKATPEDVKQAVDDRDSEALKTIVVKVLQGDMYHSSALLNMLKFRFNDDVPTARINLKTRVCETSPQFIGKHAETPEKVTIVFMHEMYHHILRHGQMGHLGRGEVVEIALDAVINTLLCNVFRRSKFKAFLTDYYPKDQFPSNILRPASKLAGFLNARMYGRLYMRRRDDKGRWGLSAEDVVNWLKNGGGCEGAEQQMQGGYVVIQLPDGRILIGSHQGLQQDPLLAEDLIETMKDSVNEALEKMKSAGKGCGFGAELLEELLEGLEARKNSKMVEAFTRALEQSGLSKIKHAIKSRFPELNDRSVLPLGFSRRNLAEMAQGFMPVFFQTKVPDINQGSVHVYIDTSGSMGDWIKWCYELCVSLDTWLAEPIHLFSNNIGDITVRQLKQGVVLTTGGTDFDCIIKHAIESKYERIIIITDGEAGMQKKNQEALKMANMKVFTVFTPDGDQDKDNVLRLVSEWHCTLKEEDKIA